MFKKRHRYRENEAQETTNTQTQKNKYPSFGTSTGTEENMPEKQHWHGEKIFKERPTHKEKDAKETAMK